MKLLLAISMVTFSVLGMKSDYDYEKAWEKVEVFLSEGRPKSALEQVDEIYKQAFSEKNTVQQVKATAYRTNLILNTKELGLETVVSELNTRVNQSQSPEKEILQSLTAELMQNYYQRNQWEIRQRTDLAEATDDIRTWSPNNYRNYITDMYLNSLKLDTKKYPLEEYKALIPNYEEAEISLRPTMFFVLLDRADNYFDYDRIDGNKSVNRFYITGEKYFAPSRKFASLKLESDNPDAFAFRKLLIYEEAINAAPSEKLKTHYDVTRLEYVFQNSVDSQKNEWYKDALLKGERAASNQYKELYVIPYIERLVSEEKKKEAIAKIAKAEKYATKNGKGILSNIKQRIYAKHYELNAKEVYTTEQDIELQFEGKNIDALTFSIVKADYVKFADLRDDAAKKYIKGRKTILTKKELLNIGIESEEKNLKFGRLPVGYYIIYATNKEGSFRYDGFWVSDLEYDTYTDESAATLLVRNRVTGQPIPNATVEFWNKVWKNGKYNRKLVHTKKANKQGILKTKGSRGEYVVVKKGKDVLHLDGYLRDIYSNRYRKDETVEFFTDRAIYRPGQTIYFKGLVLDYDENDVPHIVPNTRVNVEFKDANWQKVTSLKLKSNEFGAISGSFIIPKGGLTGNFHIRTENGSIAVKVEEYKRPKYEITFEELTDKLKLNEEITAKGKAIYLSGANVGDANVVYRVKRREKSYYWWWRPESTMITQGNTTTDAKGNFKIPFVANTDGQEGSFVFTVEVDITDTNGETRSKTWSIGLSSFDYNFKVDGLDSFDKRDKQDVTITAVNANNKALSAKATIEIYENGEEINLFKPFGEEIDYYSYYYRPQEKTLVKGKKVFSKEVSLDENGYKLAVNDLKAGSYILVVTSQDNKKIVSENTFSVTNFKKGKFPKNELLYFCGEDSEYEVGDQIDIEIGTAYPNTWAYYTWVNEGKVLEEGWVNIKKGKQSIFYTPKSSDKGGISLIITAVRNNKFFTNNHNINVPWTDKELDIKLITVKDKTKPGSEEEWKIEIANPKTGKLNGELLATMYDASLDQFVGHDYSFDPYPSHRGYIHFEAFGFGNGYFREVNYRWNQQKMNSAEAIYIPRLLSISQLRYHSSQLSRSLRGQVAGVAMKSAKNKVVMRGQASMDLEEVVVESSADKSLGYTVSAPPPPPVEQKTEEKPKSDIPTRENLNETVFFYPNIPVKDGKATISFKMNDALTTWKLLAFAHDKDLRYGTFSHKIKTQKELMILPNGPRFFREGDHIVFPATVTNLTDKSMTVEAGMSLSSNGEEVTSLFGLQPNKKVTIPAGESKKIAWNVKVPADFKQLLEYKVWASTDKHQDAEKGMIPVLTNQKLITDTDLIALRSGQEQTLDLTKFGDKPYRFTFEYTSNPVWYAVQALPYMSENTGITITSIFNRYYTNRLASHITKSNPVIKRVLEQWRAEGSDALISNLEKNPELKEMLLKETPWVAAAKNETEQKARIIQLFDDNNMKAQERYALEQLKSRQLPDGGWGWCHGRSSLYMTLHVLEGIGHLKDLGINDFEELDQVISKALNYVDRQLEKRYEDLEKSVKRYGGKMSDNHLDYTSIFQLYTRRYFKQPILASSKKAYKYYYGQSAKYWLGKGLQAEAMIALYLLEKRDPAAQKIITSLEERSFYSDELGRYWNQGNGYHWYDLPIEAHATLIELFNKNGQDAKFVEDAKIWLLKNKQTNNWGTYASTAKAIYALLLDNGKTKAGQWLEDKTKPTILFDGKKMEFENVQVGTGYVKLQYVGKEAIAKQPKKITIKNNGKTIGWGAVYIQHFESLDEVKSNRDNPLNIRKKLYKEVTDDNGTRLEEIKDDVQLKIGDRVISRIEIKTDRAMDYVSLKDMIPSGFEPENVISSYKWKGGLGYYESTRDLSSNFFISHLRKGTYVFEYPLRVVHEGNYSGGIAIIQSEYAPEFTSHSEGDRVNVE